MGKAITSMAPLRAPETGYREIDYRTPGILLIGSEREGLSVEQADVCDHLVCLPIRGRSTSLNLAVAAGVMLYAMLESFREDYVYPQAD